VVVRDTFIVGYAYELQNYADFDGYACELQNYADFDGAVYFKGDFLSQIFLV